MSARVMAEAEMVRCYYAGTGVLPCRWCDRCGPCPCQDRHGWAAARPRPVQGQRRAPVRGDVSYEAVITALAQQAARTEKAA